jgi:hypothetical protein
VCRNHLGGPDPSRCNASSSSTAPVAFPSGCCDYAASGALSGRLTDLGINDDFRKRAARTLRSGNATLFLLICKLTTGTVLWSSVDETKEQALQAALAGARAASAEAEVELPAGAGHSGLVETFCEQVQMRPAIERLLGSCGAVRAS